MRSFICSQCGYPFEAKREAVYCSAVCRSRAWKAKHPDGRQMSGERVRHKPAGLQVSYRKLVVYVAQGLMSFGMPAGKAHDIADLRCRELLSPAQRERLEANSSSSRPGRAA